MNGMETDEQLMIRVGQGEEFAFVEIVNRYQKKIWNLCWRYCLDRANAEDLTQEVFLKVWKAAASFRGQAKFSTWLYRIAVNTSLNHRSKNQELPVRLDLPGQLLTDSEADSDLNPAGIMEKQEQYSRLRLALEKLPSKQRLALILSRFQECSYAEIASIMNLSHSAVESLLFRAKQNLLKNIL